MYNDQYKVMKDTYVKQLEAFYAAFPEEKLKDEQLERDQQISKFIRAQKDGFIPFAVAHCFGIKDKIAEKKQLIKMVGDEFETVSQDEYVKAWKKLSPEHKAEMKKIFAQMFD